MAHHSASFSLTLRVHLDDRPAPSPTARACDRRCGRSARRDRPRARRAGQEDARHQRSTPRAPTTLEAIVAAVQELDGRRGRARLRPHVPAASRRQDRDGTRSRRSRRATTSRWPTPRASRGSAWRSPRTPSKVWNLTIKRNTVAVVTDGTAVLGLGNIGPEAAMPVMEGKAQLFKEFGGVDAWPICLRHQGHRARSSRPSTAIAPGLRRHQPRGHLRAALLRDRAAAARVARHPRLPRRPARHRDRRAGGAPERAAGRRQADRRTSASWSPASAPPGSRSPRCCSAAGVRYDRSASTARARSTAAAPDLGAVARQRFAERTNPDGLRRHAPTRRSRARTSSSGSRGPGAVTRRRDRLDGARTRSSSRWPTRRPRSTPEEIDGLAAVVATGRSDYPNQINNVLAFPGVFRGALDVRAAPDHRAR